MNGSEPTSNSEGAQGKESSNHLLGELYAELRKLASAKISKEAPGQTLQATALVHEAWIRLGDPDEKRWENRGHFFAAAAEAMRRILIDRARRRRRPKHGGDLRRTEFDELEIAAGAEYERLLEVNEWLDRLADEDPLKAEVVKLKIFVGLGNAEIAELWGVSEKTVGRHWRFAKAWLYSAIEQGGGGQALPVRE